MSRIALLYTTLPSEAAARRIADHLIAERLAACCNILPGMTAIYEWQGARETAAETVMLIKTRASLVREVVAAAETLHPYDVPCFLQLPAEVRTVPYLAWLEAQTRAPA